MVQVQLPNPRLQPPHEVLALGPHGRVLLSGRSCLIVVVVLVLHLGVCTSNILVLEYSSAGVKALARLKTEALAPTADLELTRLGHTRYC